MPAIVPLIIAGGTIGGAAIAAHASGQAAETNAGASEQGSKDQLQAAEDALAFQKQAYNNKQQAVNPYQNYGAGALAMLGQGLGVQPGHIPVGTVPVGQGINGGPVGQTVTGLATTADVQAALAAQTHRGNFGVNMPGPSPSQQQTQSGVQSVKLQSPDGSETQMVPQAQAQYYISQGARVVQ